MWNLFKPKEKERISIRKAKFYRADDMEDGCPFVEYGIFYGHRYVGSIELSLKMTDYSFYYGNIGYHILHKYRGHHFAKSACILLMQEALSKYAMQEFIITCNPDNIASIKTIEKLPKVTFLGKVAVPKDHRLYQKGEKEKLVYRVSL